MNKFAILVKTYRGDIEQAKTLLASIRKHNLDNIPVVVSVNNGDLEAFQSLPELAEPGFTLIEDHDIYKPTGQLDGWRYQQVIKSNFYRLGFSEFYLSVDSDSQFIRDFRLGDFMYNEDTPYTIMHESKDMLEWIAGTVYMREVFFAAASKALRDIFQTHGKTWDWGPNPFIWSCGVWEHITEHFLNPNNISLEDYMRVFERTHRANFSEYMLYGEYLWFMKSRNAAPFDIIPIQPLFKTYHFREQFEDEVNAGVTAKMLSQNYIGFGVQSKWIKSMKSPTIYENFTET